MKRRVFLAVFIVIMLFILAFQPVYGQKAVPKTVKIGVMYEKTGPLAPTGTRFEWGMTKAVEQVNKDGGIYIKEYDKKLPIELVTADHQSREDRAVIMADYLNDQGVVALIGTTASLPTAASVYERNQLPALTVISGVDTPFTLDYKYLFSNSAKFSDLAKSAAALFRNLSDKPRKVALFEAQADPGVETCRPAEQEFKAVGIDTIRVKFSWLTKDMSSAIMEAKKAGADAVYGLAITPDAMLMIKQMKELDFNPKAMLIVEGPTSRSAWASLGKDGHFVYTFNNFHWTMKYPGLKELVVAYEAEKKEKPYDTVGIAWSCVQIVTDAIKRAGSLDRKKIRDAMAQTNMMTVIGPAKFKANGALDVQFVPITQVQNGQEVLVFPDSMAEKKPISPAPSWKQR